MKLLQCTFIFYLSLQLAVMAGKHLEIMVPDLADTDLKGPVKSVDTKISINVSGQFERELSEYDETGNLLNETEWNPDGEKISTLVNHYNEDGDLERMVYCDFEEGYTNDWAVILNPATSQIAMKSEDGDAAVYTYSPDGYLLKYRYVDENKKLHSGSTTKRDSQHRNEQYTRIGERGKLYTYWFKWREDGLIDRERQKYHQEKGEILHIYKYLKTDEHDNWTQRHMVRYDISGKERVKVYQRLVVRDIQYFAEAVAVDTNTVPIIIVESGTNTVEFTPGKEIDKKAAPNGIAEVDEAFSDSPEKKLEKEKAAKKKKPKSVADMLKTGRTQEQLKAEFDYSFDDISDKLVIISCNSERGRSAGSGFVAKMDGKTYLFTNQHVIMGADSISCRTADGETLTPRGVELSSKRDIARILIEDREGFGFSETFALNNPLGVFGNSEGAGVATELYGEVTGLGVDLVEVNAEFVSGNSGSPVLDANQEVIGIASFVRVSWHPDDDKKKKSEKKSDDTKDDKEEDEEDKFKPKTRRFCYRLDDLKWQRVRWKIYNKEYGELYRETDAATVNIFDIISVWINNPLEPVPLDSDLSSDLKRWIEAHNYLISRRKNGTIKHNNFVKEYISSLEKLSSSCSQRSWSLEMFAKKPDMSAFMKEEFYKNSISLHYAGIIIQNIADNIAGR